jgi:hypothetical protein
LSEALHQAGAAPAPGQVTALGLRPRPRVEGQRPGARQRQGAWMGEQVALISARLGLGPRLAQQIE